MHAPAIRSRQVPFSFDEDEVPRWWFDDNPLVTHYANGLNLVFPEGERFFIRSVRAFLDRIDDPELLAQVRGFVAQEASHGNAHRRAFDLLERQGFDVRTFLDAYERRHVPRFERLFPARLNLAVTVALEHLTASLGEEALTSGFLSRAHPEMRRLLSWHAAEEIEHKSVAFEVFRRVDGRYPLRILGMILGVSLLLYHWRRGARMLLAQEGLEPEELARHRARIPSDRRGHRRRVLGRAFLAYLKPSFHPDERDNAQLARDTLSALGIA